MFESGHAILLGRVLSVVDTEAFEDVAWLDFEFICSAIFLARSAASFICSANDRLLLDVWGWATAGVAAAEDNDDAETTLPLLLLDTKVGGFLLELSLELLVAWDDE